MEGLGKMTIGDAESRQHTATEDIEEGEKQVRNPL